MAQRTIRTEGDRILTKPARTVEKITEKEIQLLDDMLETMYAAQGVGLAAPQVGVLRRIAVIDVGEGPIELINPEIVGEEGEQTGDEGCLSVPGMVGTVTRPLKVKVTATGRDGEPFTIEGEGLLARALCHEIDHLYGRLYTTIAQGPLRSAEAAVDEEEEEE